MRSVYIFGGLLLLSSGGAWLRWTAEPDKIGENEILIMQGDAEDIEKISFLSEAQDVSISIQNDNNGNYLWVDYTDKKKPEDPQSKRFKAGKNGDKLLENLSPLVGIRKLTDVADKLETLGLQNPTSSLAVTRNGKERSFDIGAEAYGTKDYYIRDQQSNEIFLVDDRKLTPLLKARTNLPDRSLWTEKPTEAIAALITHNDTTISLEHSNWQDKQNAKWIHKGTPEADNTQLETWIGKFLRLSSSRYQSDEDTFDELEKRFSVALSWDGKPTQTLQVYQQGEEWWAESEHTRQKVKIAGNTVEALLEDLPSLSE